MLYNVVLFMMHDITSNYLKQYDKISYYIIWYYMTQYFTICYNIVHVSNVLILFQYKWMYSYMIQYNIMLFHMI